MTHYTFNITSFIYILFTFFATHCDSLTPIYLHITEYLLSNTTQWNLDITPTNKLISCTINLPTLCLIQTSSTLTLSYNNNLYNFFNLSSWDYSSQISLITRNTDTQSHRRLGWGKKRRQRRRARRRARRKRRRERRARKKAAKQARRRARNTRRGIGPRGPRGAQGIRGARGQIGLRGAKGHTGSRGWPGRRGRSNIKLFKGLFRGIRAAMRGRRCGNRCQRSHCMNTMCGAMGMGMNPMMSGMGMDPMMSGMGMNPMFSGMGMNPMMSSFGMNNMGMNGMMGDMSDMMDEHTMSGMQEAPEIVIHEHDEGHRRMMEDMIVDVVIERCVYTMDDEGRDLSICVLYNWKKQEILVRCGIYEGDGMYEEEGDFKTNEWKMKELMVGKEQIYECHDDLLSVMDEREEYNEICVEKWRINDNDVRIVIKNNHNHEMYKDIEFSLWDHANWEHIYYIDDGNRMLCRYLFVNGIKQKLCVEFRIDTESNDITQIHKISLQI